MNLSNVPDAAGTSDRNLAWLVGIHVVFVLSGLALAWTDRISDMGHSKTGH